MSGRGRPYPHAPYEHAIRHGLARSLLNSSLISLSTVALVITTAAIAAYPLARMSFSGQNLILLLIIAPIMIPGLVNLVPAYILMAKLALLDSYEGLILIYWVHSLPMAVWILRGFFRTIPQELEDAAAVDGCSPIQTLTKIILPLSQPALAAVALLHQGLE